MKITIKNPAKARPLSANVRRLMTMAFVKSTQFEWIFWDQAYND